MLPFEELEDLYYVGRKLADKEGKRKWYKISYVESAFAGPQPGSRTISAESLEEAKLIAKSFELSRMGLADASIRVTGVKEVKHWYSF